MLRAAQFTTDGSLRPLAYIGVLQIIVASYLQLGTKWQETLIRPPEMLKRFSTEQIDNARVFLTSYLKKSHFRTVTNANRAAALR